MSGLPLQTYSFGDVFATLSGPGAPAIILGSDAGVAEEGITVEMEEDKNKMTGGSDGSVMHSLREGNRGKMTVRLLLTSPVNGFLNLAYNFQKASSATWGQNTMVVTNLSGGDVHIGQQVSFTKLPRTVYSKDGEMREWVFDVGFLEQQMGV